MSNSRRQEIYEQIKKSSKTEFIMEEMQKLGFWPDDKEQPSAPTQLIQRESELTKEIRDLATKQRKFENKEKLLQEIHKKRMTESREKQKENKERRKEEKEKKAKNWEKRKKNEILYLGENVSKGLGGSEDDIMKLKLAGLPFFKDEKELAKEMGISLGKLKFLAYNRKISTVSHYKKFYMAKKSGGKRLISAPMPDLKKSQTWILNNLLNKIKVHSAVHGFAHKKSIKTNALPHIGKNTVINIDLKDFFPSVNYRRVKGLFKSFGYTEKLSCIFALLCTEAPTQSVTLDKKKFYVATGERHLPQGSPASPAITNALCKKMDKRLQGLADKYEFTYTRYADDMTFSATESNAANIPKLLGNVRRVIKDEGFELHPDKLRIMRKGARKEVTGVVVNEKPNISRKELDKFRALIFQIEKDGIKGKTWNGSKNLLASIKGYADFINMINPEKGAILLPRVKAILDKYSFKHEIKHHPKPKKKVKDKKQDKKKSKKKNKPEGEKPWWQFW